MHLYINKIYTILITLLLIGTVFIFTLAFSHARSPIEGLFRDNLIDVIKHDNTMQIKNLKKYSYYSQKSMATITYFCGEITDTVHPTESNAYDF